MRRFSEFTGLWTPGVSTRTICPEGRLPLRSTLTMPWMRLRVVCGLRVTMASFSPTSALSNVDFPAFGRPMIETNPERNAISGLHLLGVVDLLQGHPHAFDSPFGGFEHFESQMVFLQHFARLRNVPG